MRIESGLEEMRISSAINEDVVDNSNTEQADERSEQEYRTSLDPAKSECQTVNHRSSNEAGHSHQTLHIDADGIYLHLIKPSEVFITNLSTLNSDDQEEISLLILDCCSMACYAFYENNELWRTRYSAISHPFEKRLFEKFVAPQLRLPRDFTFFELREWISRIRHALDRVGEDACSSRAVDNFVRAHGQGFNDAERIPRMKWPLGGVDVLLSEESVVQARNLCNHLRYWEGAQWLKALHMKLLEPDIQGLWYLEIFEKWLFYKDSVLKQTPQGPEVVPRLDYKAVGAARKRTRTDDGVVKDTHEDILPTMSSTQVAHLTEETSVEG